jgi:hypothetical protein
MGYSGTSSNPATSVSKDETTGMTTQRPKKQQSQAKETHSELQAKAPCQSDELKSKHDWLRQQLGKAREE